MAPKRAGDVPEVPWSAEGERALDFDQVVVLRGISWEQYVALDNAQGHSPRMAYLDGELEVMTVADRHALIKTLLARLVEVYALEADVPLIGFDQATQRNKRQTAGSDGDHHVDWVLDATGTMELA
jgi:Uma2 family endonuclease